MTNEELLQAYRKGDNNARETLIQQNIGLVHRYARLYVGKFEYDDLVQEGSIGLMKAIDDYSPDLGAKFSSYAGDRAKWTMLRFMTAQSCKEKGISYGDVDKIRKLNKDISDLSFELCKNPSIEEIAEYTGNTVEEIERLTTLMPDNRSIDAPVAGDNGDITLADSLKSSDPIAEELIYKYEIKQAIHEELSKLSDKDRYTLKAHYGFWGKIYSFEHIGYYLGVSKQAVCVSERMTFNKLRKSKKLRNLALEMQLEKATNYHHSVENMLIARQRYRDLLEDKDDHPFYKWHMELAFKKMEIENNNSNGSVYNSDIKLIKETLEAVDKALFAMKDVEGYRIMKSRLKGLSESQTRNRFLDIVNYEDKEEAAIDFIWDFVTERGIYIKFNF